MKKLENDNRNQTFLLTAIKNVSTGSIKTKTPNNIKLSGVERFSSTSYLLLLRASAPATISKISFVIAACLVRL